MALAATPGPGSYFVGWSGDCAGSAGCNLSLTANRAVTATFGLLRTLTVTVASVEGGAGRCEDGGGEGGEDEADEHPEAAREQLPGCASPRDRLHGEDEGARDDAQGGARERGGGEDGTENAENRENQEPAEYCQHFMKT